MRWQPRSRKVNSDLRATTQEWNEILRMNTYKREAWRFYFNPDVFRDFVAFGKNKVRRDFPFTFRLYFDRDFDLIGGNLRLNLPSRLAIPITPFTGVNALGGGYTKPATFQVSAQLGDLYLAKIPAKGRTFWRLDADVVLSMDEGYIEIRSGGRYDERLETSGARQPGLSAGDHTVGQKQEASGSAMGRGRVLREVWSECQQDRHYA